MSQLTPRHVDALQELTTIGCGAALTALAKLTHLRLDMDVPEAWIGTSAGAIAGFLGALGSDLVAVGVRLEGPLTGHLLLALPVADAEALAGALGVTAQGGSFGALAESGIME
jgi:chemotaxis protein CheC